MTGVAAIPESFHGSFYDATGNICENASNITTGSDEGSANKKEEKWIWVLDPLTRKLRVPLHLLAPTEATATTGTVPSLCIAYLEGRCRHPWCRQAHVHPSAIRQLRFEALNAPTCCHFHNDPHDISRLTSRFKYVRILNSGSGGNSEPISSERVASTVGLLRYLVHNAPPSTSNDKDETSESDEKGAILSIPAKSVCRLHLAHRCRYLEDCNNIHICRESEVHLQLSPHVFTTLSRINSTTRTVVLTETCYSVSMLAAGEVSDTEFDALCDAQKSEQSSFCHPPSWNLTEPGSMVPEKGTSSTYISKSPLNYPASTTLSPSSECWQNFSFVSGMLPASCLCSANSGAHAVTTPYTFNSSHLRVYDVRPKNTLAKNINDNDTATSTLNGQHDENHITEDSTPDTSFVKHQENSTPRDNNVSNGSATKMNCVTLPKCGSSTDDGVSTSSSTIRTPIKDDVNMDFLVSSILAGMQIK
ncbi:unnamed protein product [Phytomonas sp. EM1]|nr:unnamed protein product [Phytomonas sp. EM1]|eukprot:CCW62998.1 unnamed protein product [Phytomonas sp. isolate EM1]